MTRDRWIGWLRGIAGDADATVDTYADFILAELRKVREETIDECCRAECFACETGNKPYWDSPSRSWRHKGFIECGADDILRRLDREGEGGTKGETGGEGKL